MSILVCGKLELNNANMPYEEKVDLSFLTVEKATKYKIGINLGDTIWNGFLKQCSGSSEELPFELTDFPMSNVTEDLFWGKSVEFLNDEEKKHIDHIEETLFSRMMRVQNFADELLKTKLINKVILDVDAIDIDYNDIEVIEINVNDFCKKMIELYEHGENWTPTVRVIMEE